LFLLPEYHFLGEFELVVNYFDILYQSVNKYLRYIIVFAFRRERYWGLRIQVIVKTFYIITERTWGVFLVFVSIGHAGVWLASVYWSND
jgi:hypothetical protein